MDNIKVAFCEAVDTIVTERLKDIQFDRTILCSIIDTSEAATGKYLVATLSSTLSTIDKENPTPEEREEYLNAIAQIQNTFEAYSTENYSQGQYVYVLIPNGDFSQQKTIVGKYIANSNEPYKDITPFDQFVDMTGNIFPDTGIFNLIANSPKEIANTGNENDKTPTIHKDLVSNPLSAFTRIGIRAQFSTNLSQQKCVYGQYGLKVVLKVKDEKSTVTDENNDGENEDENEEENKVKYVEFELNSDNFIGNPYNFDGFYSQEQVFDISGYQSIIHIDVFFYQKTGSFKNDQYIDLSWHDGSGSVPPVPIDPNLFVKDIYIGVGYSTEDVDKDTLFLYSFDDTSYLQEFDPTTHTPKPMLRTLKVRWVHQDEATGRYETVSDFSSLYTSERTSAILQADAALQAIGTSLEANAKLKIATDFYNSYLSFMAKFRDGTAEGLKVGDQFCYVLGTNAKPEEAQEKYERMNNNIRASFINNLEEYITNLFTKLNIYTWLQEEVRTFVSEDNDISEYYKDGDALTKTPYYKYKYEQYEGVKNASDPSKDSPGLFDFSLLAIEGVSLNHTFYLPAKLDENTEIFIKLNIPMAFDTDCVYPFWRDTIESLRQSVKTTYNKHQATISSYQYQLRWYHYRLGATISDSDVYAGANWRRIDENFLIDDTLLGPKPGSLSEGFITHLTNQPEVTFTPNPNKRQEQFKCILLKGYNEDQDKNEIVFEFTKSNIFTFSNLGKVVDVDTIEKVEALSIHCQDNSFGNYFVYNLGGEITNTTESGRIRYAEAYFNPSEEEIVNGPLREAQTIKWIFPLDNFSYIDTTGKAITITGYTMLEPEISIQDILSQTDNPEDSDDDAKLYTADPNNNLLRRTYTRKTQRYQYEKIGDITDNYPDVFEIDIVGQRLIYTYKCFQDGSILNFFGYKIKSFYSQENTVNNNIGCSVVKNFITYNAVKSFNFGPSGTQGAEVVLAVNFNRDKETLYNAVTQIEHLQDGETIVSFNDDFKPARFSAFLYDADSNLVDISGSAITCQWADCVDQTDLNKWFIIEACKGEDNKWINNIPTWEVHYKKDYKDRKVAEPTFEEITASSPEEARQIATSIKNARINAIVEIIISNYGRYDNLKTYLTIPQKTIYNWKQDDKNITFTPGYISGPTKVIYDGTGHCDYYKGPYTMTAFVQDTWRNNIAGTWSLIYPDGTDYADTNYLPALTDNAVLEPLGMYIEDAPRYGIAFSSSDFNLDSDVIGKTFLVQDLTNDNKVVERVMTQELWDYISDFVNTPVNKLHEKNFVCQFSPAEDYTQFIWIVDRSENGQLLANLLHGIFPHTYNQYDYYDGFIAGNGKTYGWRVTCTTATDPYTGKRYYYKLTFLKSRDHILNEAQDIYNENSDSNAPADFLSGFLSYFQSTVLHIRANTNCWYQPIYTGQNRYMSATLNKWDGQSLSIDKENCTILAHAVAAGKKERSPTGASVFTGVVIGQMTSGASTELSKHTGVYGINQGAMAYEFLDNGTGFIGKSGRGRIIFDGNTGVIKSGLYVDQDDKLPIGSIIDFDDGRIELHGNTTSTAWSYDEASVTSNLLVLSNASAPLYLQAGPDFGGGTFAEETHTNSLVSATMNNNRLTIVMRKDYLYSDLTDPSNPQWNSQWQNNSDDDYKLIVIIGNGLLSDTDNQQALMPLFLECVTDNTDVISCVANFYTHLGEDISSLLSPLLEYQAMENDKRLINTVNFSSSLDMLLENFKINYYLCTKDSIVGKVEPTTTDNYENVDEGSQFIANANSYKTAYKKKIDSVNKNIYAVAFEIPIKASFKRFFEEMGNALSTTLTFTLSLTRRTIPENFSQQDEIEAVGSLILDAGTLSIEKNPDNSDKYKYRSSGIPFSIGVLNRKINQNQSIPKEEIVEAVNFYVEWDGTMHAKNGYFTNKNRDYYVNISSDPREAFPFKIGANHQEKFQISWNGEVKATDGYFRNGYFEGELQSSEGQIGGWVIQPHYLQNTGNTIHLDAAHGVINGPILRGAEIRGGAIFSNDLNVNFFTIYDWSHIDLDEDGGAALQEPYGLQGWYDVDNGLTPQNKRQLLKIIKKAEMGTIGLIISSDGTTTTYPLGMVATKGSIVLQVKPNDGDGSTENIRLTVPPRGSIMATVENRGTATALAMLGQQGIWWGPGWNQYKFTILDTNYSADPNYWSPSTATWVGTFQGLEEFKIRNTNHINFYGVPDEKIPSPSNAAMLISHWQELQLHDLKDLLLKYIQNITITGVEGSSLTVTNIPADKQTGIYARFA